MSVEHVVFFPAPDGTPAFRRLVSLDEAVTFVEHLRNERDVREVSVHTLAEVPLAFRTVYRVEVASDVPAQSPVDSAPEPPAEPVPAPAPVAEVPALEPVADAGAEGDSAEAVSEVPAEADTVGAGDGRTLGFFSA